jgi:biotin synthase-related radical SAM superfamily protein
LLALGVYPFLVPFVPIAGTPMANRPPPSGATMRRLYEEVGRLIRTHALYSRDMKAGCGKCGACSALSAYEGRS